MEGAIKGAAGKIADRKPLLNIVKEEAPKTKPATNGIKNSLVDLHNHLFEQLERLNDNDLTGDELKEELVRAKAITAVSSQIIANGNLMIQAHREECRNTGIMKLPHLMLKE